MANNREPLDSRALISMLLEFNNLILKNSEIIVTSWNYSVCTALDCHKLQKLWNEFEKGLVASNSRLSFQDKVID